MQFQIPFSGSSLGRGKGKTRPNDLSGRGILYPEVMYGGMAIVVASLVKIQQRRSGRELKAPEF